MARENGPFFYDSEFPAKNPSEPVAGIVRLLIFAIRNDTDVAVHFQHGQLYLADALHSVFAHGFLQLAEVNFFFEDIFLVDIAVLNQDFRV